MTPDTAAANHTTFVARKRVVATFNVPADWQDSDIADMLSFNLGRNVELGVSEVDPTVWEWDNFWLDVEEGQVGPDGDLTQARASQGV